MTSPTVAMDRYAEDLHDRFITLFEIVLENASQSEALWKHRVETFNRVGLLEFVVPSKIERKPLNIDEARLEDDIPYRRMIIRKLKAPRPSKWTRHKLILDRAKVDDDEYRNNIAKVLSFKWVEKLYPIEGGEHLLAIFQANANDLEQMLDHGKLNTIGAKWCSDFLLRQLAYELIEKNEKFIEIEARIREVGKAAREELAASLAKLHEETMASANVALNRILDDTNRKLDHALAGIQANLRKSQERSQAALAEHGIDPKEDREETFRKAVLAREAAMKVERKAAWRAKPFWVRMLPPLAIIALAFVLFFHLEVAGVTPFEWTKSIFFGAEVLGATPHEWLHSLYFDVEIAGATIHEWLTPLIE